MAALELILMLLAAVLVSAVLDQLVPKVTSPLIQIALGLGISLFFGGLVDIEFDEAFSDFFLVLFIAPLLYNDAREADKTALWQNLRPIASLAIGLVVVTALFVGFVTNALIPSIPLAAAIALGAALGPTDAVAVASLPKSVNISDRERSLLKGECLINDASGIVSFQFAVAACVYGSFNALNAGISFLVSFFGGILVGLIMGVLTNIITQSVRKTGLESTTFHVLFDLFTPFIVFLAAEPFGASGIIAVVVAGLVSTMGKRMMGPSISRMNIVSTSVWRVFSYALNGIVFVLLGTQLPKAMVYTWENVALNNGQLVAFVIFVALAVELIRFLWLVGVEFAHLPRGERKTFGLKHLQSALVMTLAGAKGTVTLSIIFTLPLFISSGALFPQRNLIIFLASGVILITLLLANFVIPLCAPKNAVEESVTERKAKETEAFLDVLRGVIEDLAARQTPSNRTAVQSVIHLYSDRIERIKPSESEFGSSTEDNEEADLEIRRLFIGWEQECIAKALQEGTCSKHAGYKLLLRLDRLEELTERGTTPAALMRRLMHARQLFAAARTNIVDVLPGIEVSEQTAEEHDLSIAAQKYAYVKLEELQRDSGDIPTERISAYLVRRGRAILTLEGEMPSASDLSDLSDEVDHIQRHALRLEMEGISAAFEEGRISRHTARKLRENVALMQVDLEEKV